MPKSEKKKNDFEKVWPLPAAGASETQSCVPGGSVPPRPGNRENTFRGRSAQTGRRGRRMMKRQKKKGRGAGRVVAGWKGCRRVLVKDKTQNECN